MVLTNGFVSLGRRPHGALEAGAASLARRQDFDHSLRHSCFAGKTGAVDSGNPT
jgi:hypothetical protein